MSDLPGYGQAGSGQPGYGQRGFGPAGPGQPGPAGGPGYGGQLPRYGETGYGPPMSPMGGWAAPAPMPGGVPLRPLSAGEMLSGAFTLIRRNPIATLGLAAIVETASAVITTFVTWSEQKLTHELQVSLKGHPTSAQVGHALGHFFGSFVPYLFITIAVALVAQGILTGMLTGALGRGLIGDKVTIGEAWRIARVPAVIALSLLVLAIVFVPWVLFGLIIAGLAAAHVTAAAVLIGVVGGIGLVVATLWVSIRLLMAVPAVVLENAGPIVALRRSWQLVQGSWWRVFGIYLLAGIVVAVIAGVIEIPFSVARILIEGGGSILSGLGNTAKPTLVALIIGAIGGIIATTCTRPISAGVSVLLYADLRMRKEGLDLVLQHAGQTPGMSDTDFASLWQAGPRQSGFATGPGTFGPGGGPGYFGQPGGPGGFGQPGGPGSPGAGPPADGVPGW